ncbi:hypothetical protein [Tardiphaga sp. P9-11]|uniref:hypothetical protein n=1 Tax=Tardiphaga sp. P9-11 TaxID=2024614 RepID=UPI0011F3D9F2|nr:hypothetical protein [Tardiphaga sp. P9-11]KAA0070010.1 hypothetical protein CIW50_28010 [Tardiphaga sp. P9-11]
MSKVVAATLNSEAIFAKSKAYMQRALRCKQGDNHDEYQLWASLALELLGKACLARIHPSLIALPNDQASMFAASGISLSTDIKTISSHTLYDRLRHITKGFDETVKTFCDDISQRRNAELHSGEVPFREMKPGAWEGRFWHAAQLILVKSQSSLEEWLGADQAKAPKVLLMHAQEALVEAAKVRVERARANFFERKKKEREEALTIANTKSSYHYSRMFSLLSDHEWETKCPSCTGKAFIAGIKVEEVVLDDHYEEESVDILYVGEEFHCPVCELHLAGSAELEAAGLTIEHSEIDTRERRYEEGYNND